MRTSIEKLKLSLVRVEVATVVLGVSQADEGVEIGRYIQGLSGLVGFEGRVDDGDDGSDRASEEDLRGDVV